METFQPIFHLYYFLSSYPTYEEWKPLKVSISVLKHISSYPTYEEWKRQNAIDCLTKSVEGSYPTYEEWKQVICMQIFIHLSCSYPTYEEWKLYNYTYIS